MHLRSPSDFWLTLITFLVALLIAALLTLAAYAGIPSPRGNVSDYIGKLTKTEQGILTKKIEEVKGVKIVIAIVPDMGGEDVVTYATDMFNVWGIGSRKEDNGVLILLAMKERKIRIQTGYGTEGKLPDHVVKTIIDQKMVPQLAKGEFYVAFYSAITEIDKLTKE